MEDGTNIWLLSGVRSHMVKESLDTLEKFHTLIVIAGVICNGF
jgi:hypothetical protein